MRPGRPPANVLPAGPQGLAAVEIAEMNLLCAAALAGAENQER